MTLGVNRNKKYFIDILVTAIILTLPFLTYIHLLFEEHTQVLSIFGYPYQHNFPGNDHLVWHITIKLIPILLFLIWFLGTSYGWRYYIFLPIAIFIDSLVRYTLGRELSGPNSVLLSFCCITCIVVGVLIVDKFVIKRMKYDKTCVLKKALVKNDVKEIYERAINLILSIQGNKFESPPKEYLLKLCCIQNVLIKEVEIIDSEGDLPRVKKQFSYLFIGIFLTMPVFYNLHRLIPNNIKTLNIGIFSITSQGFPAVDIFVWLLFLKLSILFPWGVWFITCHYWWKYAILSPIILFSYQVWEMFQDVRYIDAWGNLNALPYVLCVVILLIYLSEVAKYRSKILDVYDSISREVAELIEKADNPEELRNKKSLFEILRQTNNSEEKAKKNLFSLIKLQKELINRLEIKN